MMLFSLLTVHILLLLPLLADLTNWYLFFEGLARMLGLLFCGNTNLFFG